MILKPNHYCPGFFRDLAQPLQLGDVNKDGREDIYLGNAKGAIGELLMQKPDGTFSKTPQPCF